MSRRWRHQVSLVFMLWIGMTCLSQVAYASDAGDAHALTSWSPVFGLVGLLALAVIMFPLANKMRFPYTVMLAIVGGVIGVVKLMLAQHYVPLVSDFLIALDSFNISSDMVFFVFLPALVFESALSIDVRRLMEDIAPILFLAVVGLIISTAIVGFLMHAVTPFSLVVCLLLGAIVSATDPVAVVAIFKDLAAPKRLAILVEGESLFNDATAIVAFTLLSGMLMGTTDAGIVSGTVSFLKVFIGGILVGYLLARIYCLIFSWLGDIQIAKTTLSITLAYLSFIYAEHFLHVSGVMAVVTAALVVGSHGRSVISLGNWHALHEVWEQIGFIANSIIFLLVGLAVPVIMQNVSAEQWGWLAILLVAAFSARALIIFGLLPIMSKAKMAAPVTMGYQAVMYWGGLRGAVSLALALAVMENDNFSADIQIFIGMLVCGFVIFTLFVNATTMQFVMKLFGLNKLSRTDTAIKERALVNALTGLQSQAENIAAMSDADKSFVIEVGANIDLRKSKAVEAFDQVTDLSEDQWTAVGLKTIAQREEEVYSHMYDRGLIASDSARRLLANTKDLADGVKQYKESGYLMATRKNLEFKWNTHTAMWLQRKCNISTPLASQLGHRFEDLCSMVVAQRELLSNLKESLQDFLSTPAIDKVTANLRQRLALSEREQQAMRSAYPDYAEKLERRMYAMAMARMEQTQYASMLKAALISNEVKTELMHELEMRSAPYTKRPALDLGLDTSALLAKVPLFAELSDKARKQIASILNPRLVIPGEYVVQLGEVGDAMYFISTGAIRIELERGDIILGSGEFFGELALLSDQPRNASALSDTYTDLLVLHVREFRSLMKDNPSLKSAIEKIAAERDN